MRVLAYLLYFLFSVLIVIFATQNMQPVAIYLVLGPPLNLPLIVVIGLSFFIGFSSALLNVVLRTAKGNSARKRVRQESQRKELTHRRELYR